MRRVLLAFVEQLVTRSIAAFIVVFGRKSRFDQDCQDYRCRERLA
jgi:hypothetical protein